MPHWCARLKEHLPTNPRVRLAGSSGWGHLYSLSLVSSVLGNGRIFEISYVMLLASSNGPISGQLISGFLQLKMSDFVLSENLSTFLRA